MRTQKITLLHLASVILASATLASASLSKPKTTTIPLVQQAPVIDGRLDDAVWRQASVATSFLNMERLKATIGEQTRALMLRTETDLYFAFTCYTRDPARILATRGPESRDYQGLYRDDVIEIFIDPRRSTHDCYHWIINSRGAIWDCETHRQPETETLVRSPQWDGDVEAAGSVGADAWYLEVRIGLKSFNELELADMQNKLWGLQFGRENWRTRRAEVSTWSAALGFGEPKDFGSARFGTTPVVEEMVTWQQERVEGLYTMDPPRRFEYNFPRIFTFGRSAAGDIPDNLRVITPQSRYGAEGSDSGFSGFGANDANLRAGGRAYSHGTTSFAAGYISGRDASTFSFDLPAGEYGAVVVCGTPDTRIPIDMDVSVDVITYDLYHPQPYRYYTPLWINFSSDGKTPVQMLFTGTTKWAVNMIAVAPRKDLPEARRAFYWMERDFYSYPFENNFRNAKVWLAYPPQGDVSFTAAEREAGFALLSMPPTHHVSHNYRPVPEDSRDALSLLTAPGRRAMGQLAVAAIEPLKSLEVMLSKLPDGIKIQVMQSRLTVGQVGRQSLRQFGYSNVSIWRPEPHWLDSGETLSYWLLVDIAPDTPAGVYTGNFMLLNEGREIASREFRIAVLPFNPVNERQTNAIYINAVLCDLGSAAWENANARERELMVFESEQHIADLPRHGIDNVHFFSPPDSFHRRGPGDWTYRISEPELEALKLFKKYGIKELGNYFDFVYDAGGKILQEAMEMAGAEPINARPNRYRTLEVLPPEFYQTLTRIIGEHMASRRNLGMHIPAYELWDEPGSIAAPALVPMLKAIKAAGGTTHQTLVASCFPTLSGLIDIKKYNGIALGVTGGEAASPEEIMRYRREEKSMYLIYQNSTIMERDARIARQAYGYWAWAWNLNGLIPWKYWKITRDPLSGGSYHPLTFDIDGSIVATTPSWEAHAEGVLDNDLLQTLENLATGQNSNAVEARRFIAKLKEDSLLPFSQVSWTSSPLTGEIQIDRFRWPSDRYDFLRTEIVRRILDLQGVAANHPALMQEIEKINRNAREREAAFWERRNRDLPPTRQGNLLRNGDFALSDPGNNRPAPGFSHWSPRARVATGAGSGGKNALQFRANGTPNDGVRPELVELVPGKHYQFTARVKRTAEPREARYNTGFFLHSYASRTDRAYTRRESVWFPDTAPTFDWQKFEFSFTAEARERFFSPWVYVSDGGGEILIENMELLELD